MATILQKIFGTKHERELKRLQPMVDAVGALEKKMERLSDQELRARTAQFKEKLANGSPLDDLLVPAFATCREAGKRALGMRHYDVQLLGGIVLHEGRIAEMRTGEGKTLVATLPCYLNALSGKGVHVVTVNDYLARRDAEWMGQLHQFLGLEVGIIGNGQNNADKSRAYASDITYGQNNEYGFDYLRDNMKFSIYDYVQRELNFAIVDEVDSILVDEARTPLIISGPGETASDKYKQIDEVLPRLRRDEHYELDEKARQVTLTEEGMETSQRLLHSKGLTEVENLYDPVNLQTLHILQQCLKAHTLFKRDQHYMVSPQGKVMIVDEFTGRTLAGRRWSDGLHQAVEAKERVPIQDENITLATISFQNFFRLYNKLSGMTGTADTEASEFHKIYKLDVVVVPTNRPIARKDHEDLIYKSEKGKFSAIVDEILDCHGRGQPVLVGTTSVEKSEVIAQLLERKGIGVNVLNAKQHELEAYVVAQAGKKGAITVATNMAGRGTDILLGGNPEMLARMAVMEQQSLKRAAGEEELDVEAEVKRLLPEYEARCKQEKKEVLEAGGLHILGTERHESRRIDNQLRGRSGRQGDPGSSRFFLSLEDDLMRIFAGDRMRTMMDRLGMEEDMPIEHKWVTRSVENAQKKVEERNFDIRKNMLEYDDVMNQQRKSMYTLRRQVLMGQYRTVPTEEEIEKGVKSEPVVTEAEDRLVEVARPIVTDMVKLHGAALPQGGVNSENVAEFRKFAFAQEVSELGTLRHERIEKDVYMWFGCRLDLAKLAKDPAGALEYVVSAVGMSLTEQRERLLDLVDEIVGTLVDRHCPPKKHHEDWDKAGLAEAYEKEFGIAATGLKDLDDVEDLAAKLYGDVEAVLTKKETEFRSESYLRLFRNIYMQEIDRQWINHLQSMDSLRDGIGLRGYGQRDPKREYKREGYNLFMFMMQEIKATVGGAMLQARQVTEEELQQQEAQRQAQSERRLSGTARHPDASGGGDTTGSSGAGPGAGGVGGLNRRQRRRAVATGQKVSGQKVSGQVAPGKGAVAGRAGAGHGGKPAGAAPSVGPSGPARERPKVGRNDPCWCGSGTKYKSCHYREDQVTASM